MDTSCQLYCQALPSTNCRFEQKKIGVEKYVAHFLLFWMIWIMQHAMLAHSRHKVGSLHPPNISRLPALLQFQRLEMMKSIPPSLDVMLVSPSGHGMQQICTEGRLKIRPKILSVNIDLLIWPLALAGA